MSVSPSILRLSGFWTPRLSVSSLHFSMSATGMFVIDLMICVQPVPAQAIGTVLPSAVLGVSFRAFLMQAEWYR